MIHGKRGRKRRQQDMDTERQKGQSPDEHVKCGPSCWACSMVGAHTLVFRIVLRTGGLLKMTSKDLAVCLSIVRHGLPFCLSFFLDQVIVTEDTLLLLF